MIYILAGIAIIFAITWYTYETSISSLKRLTKSIPGPKPVPILGNILDIRKEEKGVLEYLIKCSKKYGPVFRNHLPGQIGIVLVDPEDVEVILRNNDNLSKSDSTVLLFEDWVGNGLFLSTGAHWKEQRKLITPTFHFNILEKFYLIFSEQSNILIDILQGKSKDENIDMFPLLQLLALDIICETAMGIKIHAQTKLIGNNYVTAVNDLQILMANRGKSFINKIPFVFPFTPMGRAHKKAIHVIKSSSDRVIRKRHDELLESQNASSKTENSDEFENSKKKLAFLDLLLQARRTNGQPLTNKEINDEVDTFMFAGHDTTSTQMSFLLYALSRHQDIQENLYKEQCDILSNEKRDPTFKEVQDMHSLERAIKESQRLYPAAPMITRKLSHPIKLNTNDYQIPAGCMIIILIHEVHRNPKVYSNPEKFDPDRFLPENVHARNPYSFIPFSAGPRNCIGQKFAMLEMKTCISKIIRNFKILPAYDENGKIFEIDVQAAIVLKSMNGLPVRLLPRK